MKTMEADAESNGNKPDGRLPARRSLASLLGRIGFWTIGAATLLNFNHFSHMTVGAGWPVSLGAGLCSALVCLTVRLPLRETLGLPGLLGVATLTSYFLMGLSVALITDVEWYSMSPSLPFQVGLAILVIVATALGASAELRRLGVERMLKRILLILTAACISILGTPFLTARIYTIPQHLIDIPDSAHRFRGFFTSPNFAGEVACYAAGLALILLVDSRYRKFSTLALILGSAAILATLSRSGILILMVFLFFFGPFLILSSPRRRQSIVRALVIALIGSGAAFVLFAAPIEHLSMSQEDARTFYRLMWIRTFGTWDPQDLFNNREILWSVGLSQIAESPLFGQGLLQFHFLENTLLCRLSIPCGVHNSYLMVWGEAGIIPFSLYVFFTGSLLWKWQVLPRSITMNAVAALTFVFAAASLRVDGTLYLTWHAFILGTCCALAAHAARESRVLRSGHAVKTRTISIQTVRMT